MSEIYIIAIDFGTAYSGYAYSLTPRKKDIQPYVKRWGQEHGHDTPKTPTCILFDENEEFQLFGYKAKDKYLELDKEDANKYYLFENFKMALYNQVSTGLC